MISALLQRRQSVPAAAAKRWWRERFVVRAAANTIRYSIRLYAVGMVALRGVHSRVDGWARDAYKPV